MKSRYSRIFGLLFLAAFGGVSIATSIPARTVEAESNSPAASEESSAAFVFQDEFEPVDNMHHFMEYVYEPVYKELKESLKLEPADKKAWAKVKSGSMILAEASSLLAKRPSEKADGKKVVGVQCNRQFEWCEVVSCGTGRRTMTRPNRFLRKCRPAVPSATKLIKSNVLICSGFGLSLLGSNQTA